MKTALLAAFLLAASPVPAAAGDEEGKDPSVPGSVRPEDQGRAREIVDRALEFLAARVESDGSFSRSRSASHHPTLAIVALGALAFMAGGYTADDGPYFSELRRTIQWLLNHAEVRTCHCGRKDGEHQMAYLNDPGDPLSRMHGHGYATWALAMAYGMSFGRENEHRRVELQEKLQLAVHCIEASQTETGGWGYLPEKSTDHEGSVTITQIEALRAARDAGLRVDAQVIDRAVEYIRKSQVRTGHNRGGFRYRLGDPKTTFSLTAAAVSCLNQTGIYDSELIDSGIEYMRGKDPDRDTVADETWPWYRRLYATQAYWQFKDLALFRRYYPVLVETAARAQDPRDGSFSDDEHGEVYATAMAALTLAIPFGYLPSFQR